ncbi:BolA family protein [Sneathiella litorea]|uniref:BolA/IbaG family iron-sulfur metabolism protein n=1 Tax=Sneathiella litorea TaxID=2606216 RepID=A0A6L8W401_9PROT|nr:BolA family protein [Sneathiella litorea]MZR29283.1 BolA/IbaG family iron-sulfur metabolism protein [Sneathiella litorea]
MSVAATIERKLNEAFSPSDLVVIDESHLHAGHAGARPEGESHFRVEITADKFKGMSRVASQRAIYEVLAEELSSDIHALALTVRS